MGIDTNYGSGYSNGQFKDPLYNQILNAVQQAGDNAVQKQKEANQELDQENAI